MYCRVSILSFFLLFFAPFITLADVPYPTLSDEERPTGPTEDNPWCIYQNQIPFVKEVVWDHPDVKTVEKLFTETSVFKSVFSYTEWEKAYGLESGWSTLRKKYLSAESDAEREIVNDTLRGVNFRNFMKVLCGEHRDFPYMLKKKLQVIAKRTIVVPESVEDGFNSSTPNIWKYFTGERYRQLRYITSQMYQYWNEKLNPVPDDGEYREKINYNFTDPMNGKLDGSGTTNRLDHSVPPIDHCQLKFIFEKYLIPGKELDSDKFDSEYATYSKDRKNCVDSDFEWMYNNRGHKNFQPLWLDSNAMVWASRVAAKILPNTNDGLTGAQVAYYKRPFASRYALAKSAWGLYLFYPENHDEYFRQASESGGGPQVYIQNTMVAPGIAEYRLNPEWYGEGDTGLDSQARPIDEVLEVDLTSGFSSYLKKTAYNRSPDWGFLDAFEISSEEEIEENFTFAFRMKRLNQAIDRHTNWGPTILFAHIGKDSNGEDKYKIYASFSPLVAASYMIDASHAFATSDYPTTHPDEQGKTKWMYIMKFPKKYYYSEENLENGDPIDWRLYYLNEAGLSNDYYVERALDHFATIPPDDIDANLYLVESGGSW